jgi:hypothetical protein
MPYTKADLPDVIEKANIGSSMCELLRLYPAGSTLEPVHLRNTLRHGKLLISRMIVGSLSVSEEEVKRLLPEGCGLDAVQDHAEASQIWSTMTQHPRTAEVLLSSLRSFLECLEQIESGSSFESLTAPQRDGLVVMQQFFEELRKHMMGEANSLSVH